MPPLYDFECTEGHRFEKNVPSADMTKPVPCEVEVIPASMHSVMSDSGDPVVVISTAAQTLCTAMAIGIITHSNPRGSLDHGLAANRDAALAGTWDPNRPITRGVRR